MSHYLIPALNMTRTSIRTLVTTSRWSMPLLGMAAVFTLAGCNNSQNSANDSHSAANETTETATAATEEVLRIGY